MPSVSRRRPIEAAVRSVCSPASRRSAAAAGRAGSSASTSRPRSVPAWTRNRCPRLVDQLGEREIVPGRDRRAGVHRDAEARPARAGAVDRHEEGVLAACFVVRVDVAVAEEDAILDRHRVQVARADAEERVAGRGRRRLDVERPVLRAAGAPDADDRREEEALDGVVPDRVREQRTVVPWPEPVGAAVLHVLEPGGQLVGRRDLVVDDRLRTHARPDHGEPPPAQRADQLVDPRQVDGRRHARATGTRLELISAPGSAARSPRRRRDSRSTRAHRSSGRGSARGRPRRAPRG